MGKAHALFYKGLKEVGRNESKINVAHGKIKISFFVGSATAAKYTLEGDGLAGEGWKIKTDVFAAVFTKFCEDFFEAIVKPSGRKSRSSRLKT